MQAVLHTIPLHEAPDLHDPYSDLTLFLASRIREEVRQAPDKQWSVQIQDKLLAKIAPEFKKRFPAFRLGVAALKKIWEKVAHLATVFESQKGALTQDGHLNLWFLIRENLKELCHNQAHHPYLLAQRLALKVAESVATFDGVKPTLRHITALIVAMQRHLMPPAKETALEPCDKLIVKYMIEALGKNPELSFEALKKQIKWAVKRLSEQEERVYRFIDCPEGASGDVELFTVQAKALIDQIDLVELDHKITLWAMQSDLVFRLVKLPKSPLMTLIETHSGLSLKETVRLFLRRYPKLKEFVPQIAARARTIERYLWYHQSRFEDKPTIEIFYAWYVNRPELKWKDRLPLLPLTT
jgi:hypothetical protein